MAGKDLNEWLKGLNGKKAVIITDSVKNGNRLIRRYNRLEGALYHVECMAVPALAEEVLRKLCPFSKCSENEAVFLVEQLLRDKGKEQGEGYFIQASAICEATARAVYEAMNLIRQGKTTEAYEQEDTAKIKGVKELIGLYEDRIENGDGKMQGEKYLDTVQILKEAVFRMEQGSSQTEDREAAGGKEETVYGILEGTDKKLAYLERKFLEALTGQPFEEIDRLTYLQREANGDLTMPVHPDFFKGYGLYNEVRFVKDRLTDPEHPVHYGDVHILYTDERYEAVLSAVLGAARIPYTFAGKRAVSGDRYIRLILDILEWAESGFAYEKLRPVFLNSVLMDSYGLSYIYQKTMPSSSAWGLTWYQEMLSRWEEEHERRQQKKKEEQDQDNTAKKTERKGGISFPDFIRKLTGIFQWVQKEERISPADLLIELCAFTRENTASRKEKAAVYGALVREAMGEYWQEGFEKDDLTGCIHFLQERLTGLKTDGTDQAAAVALEQISQAVVFERSQVFLLGCETASFSGSSAESPVLSDQERENYLDEKEGYIALAQNREKEKREALDASFASMEKNENGRCAIGYSYYDTVRFMECAPSSYYLEKKEIYSSPDCEVADEGSYPQDIEGDVYFSVEEFWKKALESLEEPENAEQKPGEKAEGTGNLENGENPGDEDGPEHEDEWDDEVVWDDEDEWVDVDGLDENDDEEYGEDAGKTQEKASEPCLLSATSLDTLIGCPLRYYYHYQQYLPDYPLEPASPEKWLSSMDRGTLIHAVLEAYGKRIIGQQEAGQAISFDAKKVDEIFREKMADMRKKVPCLSDGIYEQFYAENCEPVKEYLKRMIPKFNEEGWRIYECEMAFGRSRDEMKEQTGTPLQETYPGRWAEAEDGQAGGAAEGDIDEEEGFDDSITFEDDDESDDSITFEDDDEFDDSSEFDEDDECDNDEPDGLVVEYNGIIDRVDFKYDPEDKVLTLRVVDYKTGQGRQSAKMKEEAVREEYTVQHLIYVKALWKLKEKILNDLVKYGITPDQISKIKFLAQYDFPFIPSETPGEISKVEVPDIAAWEQTGAETGGHAPQAGKEAETSALWTGSEGKVPFPESVCKTMVLALGEKRFEKLDDLGISILDIKKQPKQKKVKDCKYCNYCEICINNMERKLRWR